MQNDTQTGWDQFWSAPAGLDAYSKDGQSHPTLDQAWMEFFARASQDADTGLKALDLASGRGVVVGYLRRAFPDGGVDIACLDTSPAAIASIKDRFGAVTGHVADARKTGLASGAYDIVTSQFGIEYAGPKAFPEAMRLVKPGGHLGLVIHCKDGQIDQSCRQSLDAVRSVLNAKFMETATKAFTLGFSYFARGQNLAGYQKALGELQRSVAMLDKVLATYGSGIANHSLARLREDIVSMAGELQTYEREETLRWLARMQDELRSYVGRMHSMCQAAVGKDLTDYIRTHLREQHFDVIRFDLIDTPDAALPVAWCLQARKTV